MLSRRLIRIKVFKVLFGRVCTDSDSISSAEAELMLACEKTRDLYFYILNTSLALKRYAEEKIDVGLQKFCPTPEEANPNRRFVEIDFFRALEEDSKFIYICETQGLVWGKEHKAFIKKLYKSIQDSEYYKEFMNSPKITEKDEMLFLKRLFQAEFEDNTDLEDILEDMSPYWIDDLGYILIQIIKTIGQYSNTKSLNLPSVFKIEIADKDVDDFGSDDKEFAKKLLRESMLRHSPNMKIIASMIPNWDHDRLVFADMILISLGISEAIAFPGIPIKVSINEYVEISKFYSTANSSTFVNGLLDKILKKMIEDKKIIKTGRGLI